MNEESLFAKALEIASPEERKAFLEEACGDDVKLRQAVEVLLELHQEAHSFLEVPAIVEQESSEKRRDETSQPTFITPHPDGELADSEAADSADAGGQVGPYRLVKRIGRGGMGDVWLAEQTHPVRRKVALKLIKLGMDSREVLARFEAERQALAVMDHPHIARVFDAGTTDRGRPYFVMELVNGIPITNFSDKHRLSIRERLELLVPVCQAIQHAHQKGIIHRDIKPSNVLVTSFDGRPMVKVIDFGVAKAVGQQLTEETMHTGFGSIVGTLEYMSPEQAVFNARDVDTRTDVYALGVLLYELLTGSTPLDRQRLEKEGVLEMLRFIREVEPPKPSLRLSDLHETLASLSAVRQVDPARYPKLLRGDLDWIAMKALEKDRDRRYQTAADLSDEIQRFLSHEAVEACPPSRIYRFRKFVRRHRFWIAATTMIVLALLLGLIGTGWQAYRATVAETNYRIERDEAVRQTGLATAAKIEAERLRGLEHEQRLLADERAETLRRQLNMSRIIRAGREIDANRLVEARQLLQQCDLDYRGWSWKYLDSLMTPERLRLQLNVTPLLALAASPVRSFLAVGPVQNIENGNIEIRLLDTQSGEKIGSIPCQSNSGLQDVSFSADGSRVLVFEASRISIWDIDSQQQISGHEFQRIAACCLSPDGRRLAYSLGPDIHILDIEKNQEIRTLHPQTSGSIVPQVAVALNFSPDGKTLGSADGGAVRLWDVESGQPLHVLQTVGMLGDVVFSPDGKYVASATTFITKQSGGMGATALATVGQPSFVKVWHVSSGLETSSVTEGVAGVSSISFSPDGRHFAIATAQGHIKLWSLGPLGLLKERIRTLLAHNQGVIRVAFGRQSKHVMATTFEGQVLVWDVKTGLSDNGFAKQVSNACKLCRDGSRNASLNNGMVEINETSTSHLLQQIPLPLNSIRNLTFDTQGERLAIATAEGRIGLWKIGNESPEQDWTVEGASFEAIAINNQGDRLATAEENGQVTIWDIQNQVEERSIQIGDRGVQNLSFGPESKLIITADQERMLKVWRIDTGEMVRKVVVPKRIRSAVFRSAPFNEGGYRPSSVVAFHPQRSLMAVADNRSVTIVDLDTGETPIEFVAHSQPINSISFSPDGETLSTASADNTIRLWEVATGSQKLILNGHGTSPYHPDETSRYVSDVAYDSRGGQILSVGADATIRLWDTHSGEQMLALPEEFGYLSETIAFDLEDRRVFASSSALKQETTIIEPTRLSERLMTPHLRSLFDSNSAGVSCVRLSPDGTQVASSNRGNGTIKLASLNSDSELVIQAAAQFGDFAFSNDGTMIAAVADAGVYAIWNTSSGNATHRFTGRTERTGSVAFSPNDRYLAASGAAIWEIQTGEAVVDLTKHPGTVAFYPDGKRVAVLAYPALEILNVATGEVISSSRISLSPGRFIRFDSKCETIVTAESNGNLQVWDAGSGTLIHTLEGHNDHVFDARFSPDGRTIASTDSTGQVILWNRLTGTRLNSFYYSGDGKYAAAGSSLDFSRDGRFLAVGHFGGYVRVVDLATLPAKKVASVERLKQKPGDSQRQSGTIPLQQGRGDETIKSWQDRLSAMKLTEPPNRNDPQARIFADLNRKLARAYSVRRDWVKAAAHADKAYRAQLPEALDDLFHTALVLLLDHRDERFQELVAEFIGQKNMKDKEHFMTRLNMLSPGVFENQKELVQIADGIVKQRKRDVWYQLVQGATNYRAGNYREAERQLATVDWRRSSGRWVEALRLYWLAMTSFQLDEKVDARDWLQKGEALRLRNPSRPSWVKDHQFVSELELVRREAHQLINGKLPPRTTLSSSQASATPIRTQPGQSPARANLLPKNEATPTLQSQERAPVLWELTGIDNNSVVIGTPQTNYKRLSFWKPNQSPREIVDAIRLKVEGKPASMPWSEIKSLEVNRRDSSGIASVQLGDETVVKGELVSDGGQWHYLQAQTERGTFRIQLSKIKKIVRIESQNVTLLSPKYRAVKSIVVTHQNGGTTSFRFASQFYSYLQWSGAGPGLWVKKSNGLLYLPWIVISSVDVHSTDGHETSRDVKVKFKDGSVETLRLAPIVNSKATSRLYGKSMQGDDVKVPIDDVKKIEIRH